MTRVREGGRPRRRDPLSEMTSETIFLAQHQRQDEESAWFGVEIRQQSPAEYSYGQ